MCLIEHRAQFIKPSCVPAKIAVIPDCIGNPDDDITGCDAGNLATLLRRDADLAAVRERCEPTRLLMLREPVEGREQVRENTRTLSQSCGQIGLIANRPDSDGGMVIVLT